MWHHNRSLLAKSLKFDNVPFLGTREAAFISAVFAAGVAYAITTDCRDGKIEGCECDRSPVKNDIYGVSTYVRGCSANIKYGIAFSERFIDIAENMDRHRKTRRDNDIITMNLHNYRVGRKVRPIIVILLLLANVQ